MWRLLFDGGPRIGIKQRYGVETLAKMRESKVSQLPSIAF
jgi:hypothetical protein